MANETNGQTKCPKCGATDISLNNKTGKLRCNFCRFEFEPEVVDAKPSVSELSGEKIGKGASKIDKTFDSVMTLKCQSCGAEVIINTEEATRARCHWCRNALSINEKIPNGAVPDMILPFKITKEQARDNINGFVGKRKFFAHPKFRREFTPENIMGVYFPYMVVDMNAKASFSGEGEHEVRSYTVEVGSGDNKHKETRYDADVYKVEREFDIEIEGLTVEASADKLVNSKEQTNNIINSILPFDTENAVKWDANYLAGYTSEKRNVNVDALKPLVNEEAKDIARYAANETLRYYDRGVKWRNEELKIKGTNWNSAYLPVWLYSYMQQKGKKNILHYVAVNARTSETMGSVPIHFPKLWGFTILIELAAIIAAGILGLTLDEDNVVWWIPLLCLSAGPIFFLINYFRYRNSTVRHYHEKETKREMKNIQQVDEYIRRRTDLSNSSIAGRNNKRVRGKFGSKHISSVSEEEG
ncbi:MAG: hypothetical protein MJ184_08225 [Treponema sp.]|uniref:hypothetical protein n=1 Tax=Treponema sp. TaxID=166 RepID=UPI00298DE238|nr:hypothetical protein [Treponema sp.]MCQ2601330.1 hypothetical protein [Treponema sp.]